MAEDVTWSEDLRKLRAEVSSLVKTIPGQVSSVSLRAGDHAVEVTWTACATEAPSPPPMVQAATQDDQFKEVVAPLVGTFYVAPEPGAKPFVRAGERIEAGQTVGIVEAMKLLNPVSAEWGGEVVEVLVADAEPVEFGQGLVRIRPDAS